MKYSVSMAITRRVIVSVEAENEQEAIRKCADGEWDEESTDGSLMDWETLSNKATPCD